MSEKPKSTILQKYHRAISARPPEEQIERADKVKSPKLLRRFLSDKSPDALVYRFGHRLGEVMDRGLSSYELGRVLLIQGNVPAAKERFEKAVKSGDKRGHLGLAHVLSLTNTEEADRLALDHLQKVGQSEVPSSEVHLTRGRLLYRSEEDEKAQEQFEKAEASVANPQDIRNLVRGTILLTEAAMKQSSPGITSSLRAEINSEEKEGLALLEPLAEKGDISAILHLISQHTVTGKGKSGKMEKYYLLGVKFGMTVLYGDLGNYYLELGRNKDAIHTYRLAVKSGHTKHVLPLVQLILEEEKDVVGAEKACHEAIDKGEPLGYMALANVLAFQGREKEVFANLEEAHRGGVELPPEFILPVLIEKGQLAEAEKICRRNEASKPQILMYLVLIALKKNDHVAAHKLTDKFFRRIGRNDEVMQCRALAQRGEMIESRQRMARLLVETFGSSSLPQPMIDELIKKLVARGLD
jgi:tetratricopeptide (TPR) repeat protein